MTHNLQQHAKRILTYSSGTRFFCSNTKGILWPSNQTLQSRIESALDQKAGIVTVLEQWQQGNQLNPSLLRGIVEKLRDSHRLRHALEVSDWMLEQKICNLVPEDFAARFHLVDNVLGLEKAEKFFESIPENLRGESLYSSLLRSYARRSAGKNDVDKAESTFRKMRELGLLLRPSPYNSMISLYGSFGNRDKADEILREMKENNVEFDSLTVNNALRVYAVVSDIATMEKFLDNWKGITTLDWVTTLDMAKAYLKDGCKSKAREMLRRTEELKDAKSYEGLMRLYGEAGERDDVYRIWDLYKNTKEKDNEGFRALIGSLLKLDDINGAEEIYYKEWECSAFEFDVRIPTLLVSGYRKKGMEKKADRLLNKTMRNRRLLRPINPLLKEYGNQLKPSDLRDLIKNLYDSNQLSKALEASSWMGDKKVFNLFPEDYAARLHLIENVLGLEEAERFFKSSIPETMKDYSVYNTLLTSYTRSSKSLNKAEAIFEKMRELGFLSKLSPFNSMISLYIQLGKRGNVKNLVLEMKEKNIEPDGVTMNNVLKMYADETDIETMEKYKTEWDDKKMKLEMRTMDAMAKVYERAGLLKKAIEITGSKKEVHRLWNEYKKTKAEIKRDEVRPWVKRSEIKNEEYRSVIRSLLNLDDVQGAEAIYREWEPQGPKFDIGIACLLISRYYEEDDEVKVRQVENSSRQKLKRMQFKLFKEDLVSFAAAVVVASVMMTIPLGVLWCLHNPFYPLIFIALLCLLLDQI